MAVPKPEVKDYFDERFGFLVLFVLIGGILGDMVIHYCAKKKLFAQGLIPYYKSMELIKKYKLTSSIVFSGLFGGIACVIALIIGQLILYGKEVNQIESS